MWCWSCNHAERSAGKREGNRLECGPLIHVLELAVSEKNCKGMLVICIKK
jgi:hypothetical protein